MPKEAFTYSPQGRLLTQTHQIGTGVAELLVENDYDELGQLKAKKVGANAQKIDYSYNIRGWLTEINKVAALQQATDPKDLFAFKINYNTVSSNIPGVSALYNGNISETQWTTSADNAVRTYGYKYDALNRLNEALYKKGSVLNAYDEKLTYDANGNIKTLTRFGSLNDTAPVVIDELTYAYKNAASNQLMKVTDAKANNANFRDEFKDSATNTIDDYDYDANGNMTKDNNKNITAITYNHLNLPTQITFGSAGNISYIYNATGQKVQKVVVEPGKTTITTDYLGGYQYSNAAFKFFPTSEGYVEPVGNSYKYVYQYKDHLGNVRLSYDKTLAIQEENNYYPFGLKHSSYSVPVIVSTNDALKYKYNGKEWQDELGLNVYDYDNRVYDPTTGHFLQMDPLAEQGRRWSPYNYCFDNPIYFQDPDGMWPKIPSWNDVKRTYNDAKATVSRTYNQTKATITKTYNETKTTVAKTYNETKNTVVATTNKAIASTKETLKEGQKFVKDHKEQILAGAKLIQDTGDKMTAAGLTAAVVGAAITAPIGGEGAAPGMEIAGLGGIVSGVGKGIEVGVKFIAEDPEAANDGVKYIAGEMVGLGVNQIIPGPNQSATPFIKELVKIGKETTKTAASDKAVNTINEIRK